MVPDVIGWPEDEAVARLEEAGYKVERRYTGPACPGAEAERRVVRQRLLEAEKVELVVAPVLWKGGGEGCPTALRKSASPVASAPTNAPTEPFPKEMTFS